MAEPLAQTRKGIVQEHRPVESRAIEAIDPAYTGQQCLWAGRGRVLREAASLGVTGEHDPRARTRPSERVFQVRPRHTLRLGDGEGKHKVLTPADERAVGPPKGDEQVTAGKPDRDG